MADSKLFTTTKRGELQELREDLNSDRKEKKKMALKRIVANMTVGNDMSSLFLDVLGVTEYAMLDMKKMIYLFLINYAKAKPDMAYYAVNALLKDCADPNPLIRALALRNIGYLYVDKVTEVVADPLSRLLRDHDPYVRKTAAMSVLKMWIANPTLVESRGFLDVLRQMQTDSNPAVVSNAVAALTEISERSQRVAETATSLKTVHQLLAALNESTEWGQVYILESLLVFCPASAEDAEAIIDRVTPRLQHANSSVILAAVKVILYMLNFISNETFSTTIYKKLSPPLVTLLHREPEIQYVALRNILLVVQKRSDVLKSELDVFFCKYFDPIYVKLTKMEVMIRLLSDRNVSQVILELKGYATEVDVTFVRKAVRSIGRCAIKFETAAQKCIEALVELIHTKVNYVVQEAIVVIRDIFRKYPNRYESIIKILCENLEALDEPEAKGAMIWIIGQYCDRIVNAPELLQEFLNGFLDEPADVQLMLLTATVKLFLKRANEGEALITQILKWASDVDNPDLRDRAYMYWRILSTDANVAKDIVFCDNPVISTESDKLEDGLLNQLILYISSLASIYHKPPHTFISQFRPAPPALAENTSSNMASLNELSMQQGNVGDVAHGKVNERLQSILARSQASAPVATPQSVLSSSAYDAPQNPYGDAEFDRPQMPASNANQADNDLLDIGANNFEYQVPNYQTAYPSAVASVSTTAGVIQDLNRLQIGNDPYNSRTANVVISAPSSSSSAASAASPVNSTAMHAGTVGASNQGADILSLGLGLESYVFHTELSFVPPRATYLTVQSGKGLELTGSFARKGGKIWLELNFSNKSLDTMRDFAIQFNKNTFGLSPDGNLPMPGALAPSQSSMVRLPLKSMEPAYLQPGTMNPINNLQVAVKNNVDVHYFQVLIPFHVLCIEDGLLERTDYLKLWAEIPAATEMQFIVDRLTGYNEEGTEAIRNKLFWNNMFTVAEREVEGMSLLYVSAKTADRQVFLIEVTVDENKMDTVKVSIRSLALLHLTGFQSAIEAVLRSGYSPPNAPNTTSAIAPTDAVNASSGMQASNRDSWF